MVPFQGANLPSLRVSLAPLGHINPHKRLTMLKTDHVCQLYPPASEGKEIPPQDKENHHDNSKKFPPKKNYTPEN